MTHFSQTGTRLVWTGDGETLVVDPWGRDSVRIRSAWQAPIVDSDWALLPPEPTQPAIVITGHRATLSNGNITVQLVARDEYDHQTGYGTSSCDVEIRNRRGDLLLAESAPGGALKIKARQYRPGPSGARAAVVSFQANEGEHLAGMGQYQQDILDLKGSTFELAQRNSQVTVPFVVSSKGYGFLWHNPAIGRATFAANRTEWSAEATGQIDYWVTASGTPAGIAEAYARATGFAPMMPEFGLGYWQCKMRYWNQEELLEVAREYRRRGLPLDVIVADFFHWPESGDYRFDPEFWPDPRAMVEELSSLGVELMVSVWPQVSVRSENFDLFRERNALVKAKQGIDVQMAFGGPSIFVDMTSEAGRRTLWELCQKNYAQLGVRAFWLDEAEPEFGVYDFGNYRYHLGDVLEVGNLYPQHYARAFYEGLRAEGQESVVSLIRCAWAGSQRYGALVWSGDIKSTFADLRRQITAGIHIGAAGIPWFTTDIGGFAGGDPADEGFRELLVRWFQFATFCPVMRMHGDRVPSTDVIRASGERCQVAGAPNELWSFGDDVYGILKTYVELRESLRPYTRHLMEAAHREGQPVIRGLFHEFPGDDSAWSVTDEYMFGPDLLIAPVVEAGARSRTVYFPGGTTWIEYPGLREFAGGTTAEVDAPLGHIPVFGRGPAPSPLFTEAFGRTGRAS